MRILPTATAVIALSLSSAVFAAAPAGTDLAALAKSKNCFACHHPDKKVIGPGFREIGLTYAKDPSARKALAEKVLKGTSGKWGPIPMPANAHLTAEEAQVLTDWVLAGAPGA